MNLNKFILPVNHELTREKVAQHIRSNHERRDEDTFYMYGGVGDPVLWLSIMQAYKEKINKRIKINIPRGSESIPLMYSKRSFDDIEYIENSLDSIKFQERKIELKINELIAHHMYYGDIQVNNYTLISCLSGLSNIDMIKCILGLPLYVSPIRPLPLSKSILEAAKIFQENNLPAGKTILLAPLARSYPCRLPKTWFENIINLLNDEGFVVVNNISNKAAFSSVDDINNEEKFNGTIPIKLPIDLVIPFAELCGNFLGIRSGLCDLLAFSNVKKIIIYPEPDETSAQFEWVRSVAHYWSLRRNFNSEKTSEYLVSENTNIGEAIISDFKIKL